MRVDRILLSIGIPKHSGYPFGMKEYFDKAILLSKDLWFRLTVPKPLPPRVDDLGQLLPPPTPEEAKKILREAVTNYVSDGWNIEIENENDVVLGRKAKFHWIGKLVLFLVLLFIFAPLAIFYLIVVIVKGVTAKPARLHIWVDEAGRIQRR
jgi:hypothetical protein